MAIGGSAPPGRTNHISHNAPFCDRNVHVSATKWCIVGISEALWELWYGSFTTQHNKYVRTLCVATLCYGPTIHIPLGWHHNELDGVSNHQRLDCLPNRLFRRRSKKTSKFCVTDLCEWNSPVTGEFPAHGTSNAENISIWWRHHASGLVHLLSHALLSEAPMASMGKQITWIQQELYNYNKIKHKTVCIYCMTLSMP